MSYAPEFLTLVAKYADVQIDFPNLKPVTLAMWILESARGTSRLASEHRNFAGMKWRTEMKPFGKRVNYSAHDGDGYYCEFHTLDDFLRGFWVFLARSPYVGWRDTAQDQRDFIRFVGPIWAGDPDYPEKVIGLIPEAQGLLDGAGAVVDAPADESHQPTLVGTQGLRLSPDGKQLIGPEGLPIEYRGVDTCDYGRSATASKKPFAAIVLHHNDPKNSADWLVQYQIDGDPDRGGHFGYHIYIAPDGRVIQGAPMTKRTNHVSAKSTVRRDLGRFATNSNAIGITCTGAAVVSNNVSVGSKPTKAQNIRVFHLIWLLCDLYDIPFGHVYGHGEVQTTRHKAEGGVQAQNVRSWQA